LNQGQALVVVAAELRLFLRPGRRGGPLRVAVDGTSPLGHVVQSLGVPLPEVGRLLVNGEPALSGYRPASGDVVKVDPVRRLAGVNTAYADDAGDDALIGQANASRRVLLTQDGGLLCRRKLRLGAYVRGAHPDDQFRDVLDRFAPPLAPWTRCPARNGHLFPAAKEAAGSFLQPGTRRTCQAFSRCQSCGQVYWRGARSKRLEEIIDSPVRAVSNAAGK
jgi:uncharacterized protein with PIN domain